MCPNTPASLLEETKQTSYISYKFMRDSQIKLVCSKQKEKEKKLFTGFLSASPNPTQKINKEKVFQAKAKVDQEIFSHLGKNFLVSSTFKHNFMSFTEV